MKRSTIGRLIASAAFVVVLTSLAMFAKARYDAKEDMVTLTPQEIPWISAHEAGHAIVLASYGDHLRLRDITTCPESKDSWGKTHYDVVDMPHIRPRAAVIEEITHRLGGRAAEEIVFGQTTNGTGSDLVEVTSLVRKMIRDDGMSQSLGPRSPDEDETFSEETRRAIDTETRAILDAAYADAKAKILANRGSFDALRATLAARRTLTGEEAMRVIMSGKPNLTVPESPKK